MWKNTTSVPNAVFDELLPELKGTELKILLIIIRQTLGWTEQGNKEKRKESDWISSSQMQQKTGCSQRAITSAIEILVRKNLISVYDGYGSLLDSPQRRKGKTKLFFALTPAFADASAGKSANFAIVDKEWKTSEEECKKRNTSANFAEDFRKNCAQLAQKMRITKETLTKETSTKNYY